MAWLPHLFPMNPLTLIGFGEAASTFALTGGWGGAMGWDLLASRRKAMAQAGVVAAASAKEALADRGVILSLVTADSALEAARSYAPFLARGALWCDMNSVAPETKRAAAQAVEAAGAHYIDIAILAPVRPAGLAVPLMLAGESAGEAKAALGTLGFTHVQTVGTDVGRASTIKMIRSVMVKGVEALTEEMMAAAEAAGVANEVLASLDASERAGRWAERAAYNRERIATHGVRRAAEMEEAAKTLAVLDIDPVMTRATVIRQRRAGASGKGFR